MGKRIQVFPISDELARRSLSRRANEWEEVMKIIVGILSLIVMAGIAGCDDPHDNAPVQPASFHIDKDQLTGSVGGGGGFTGTHWERYTDDRTGYTILCFNPNNGGGGTSTNIACVTEDPR